MRRYVVKVHYGFTQEKENFISTINNLRVGQTVILRSARGIDHGVIAYPPKSIEREIVGLGEVIRVATESDMSIMRHIQQVRQPEEAKICEAMIEQRELKMRLVAVEHLFGGEKIIFYFLAENRVDFRELVKDLARQYRTRIEMRQIGVRDEARMLSDYEHCGRELCCRTHLKNLEPVTMRMAKMQKTTLDPSKISGHCGRLMCCLRYEDDVYSESRKDIPSKGEWIKTSTAEGRVLTFSILSRQVMIELQDGSKQVVQMCDICERCGRQDFSSSQEYDENMDDLDESLSTDATLTNDEDFVE